MSSEGAADRVDAGSEAEAPGPESVDLLASEQETTVGPFWLRLVLFGAGSICLAFAILGLFVPLLPTTPLVLVAAACYARASKRAYRWLLDHPVCGKVIRQWCETRTVPPRAKWTAVGLVFATFSFSIAFVPSCLYGYFTLFLVGAGLIVFLASLRSRPDAPSASSDP